MVEYPTYGFQDELQSRSSAEVVIEAVIMILITATAIFGNTMVCWAVFRNKRLRTIPNIYITSLAISDILMATICMPLSVEVQITSKFTKSFSFCQVQGFFGFFSAFTSIQIMTAMAINRYYHVVKPSKYSKYFTVRRTIASVVIIVILAAFGAGLHLVCGWAIHTIHYGKVTCFTTFKTPEHEKRYITFLSICYIMFPACLITACYLKIFKSVSNHKKTVFKSKGQPSSRQGESADGTTQETQQREPPQFQTNAPKVNNAKLLFVTGRQDGPQEKQQGNRPKLQANVKEVKITKTLFATVLGFTACWAPIAVIDTIDSLSLHTLSIPRQIFLLWVYLAHGSSSINPFIYGALNRSFQKEFRSIFRFKSNRRNQIAGLQQALLSRRNAIMAVQN